ncbi:NACHT domain-containing protein [Virgisporangium aurantiacum]|uniref:NACHT domain-containing protein n=1 Tax=Virgisporangium aurantiacum TaxID=175570 RepID=A0A8J3Z7R3_9ACTN|nr:NACHT domain-containing protein [Virgisporangium aurantiacum]GIJ58934.1 hypothetical protein Vau01_064500 [Virgisporangium aurantiacum]
MTRRGGKRSRGVTRADPEGGPFAQLAACLWDELYDRERRWSYRELANKTGGAVAYTTVRNIFVGEPWKWPKGQPLLSALGVRNDDLEIWRNRWATARREEDERRRQHGLDPLPWLDDKDHDVPIAERAVEDWAAWPRGRTKLNVLVGHLAGLFRRHRRGAAWERRVVLTMIRDQAAEVLGHTVVDDIRPTFRPAGHRNRSGAAETSVRDLFENAGMRLVLLSEPGLGKTYQLAHLARGLAEEQLARLGEPGEPGHEPWWEIQPVPFLLRLDTYQGQPLEEWLATAINRQYGYAIGQARSWLQAPGVLPLLDGLDEVAEPHRAVCVRQISGWERLGRAFAVTCRSRDYHLARTIRAGAYVEIAPLTRPQVQKFVSAHPQALADVRSALDEDRSAWKLLVSPFMLNVIRRAYADAKATDLRALGADEHDRAPIFDAYVRRMLTHRQSAYDHESTLRWLTWLARTLTARSEHVLYLDRLDPTWVGEDSTTATLAVPGVGRRALLTIDNLGYLVVAILGATLGATALIAADRSASWPAVSVVLTLAIVGFTGAVWDQLLAKGPQPVEEVRWSGELNFSWKGTFGLAPPPKSDSPYNRFLNSLPRGVYFGLVAILTAMSGLQSLFWVAIFWLLTGLYTYGLLGAVLVLSTLNLSLSDRLAPRVVDRRPRPTEGIRRSVRHSVGALTIFGVGFGAAASGVAAMMADAAPRRVALVGVIVGAYVGLSRALGLGGYAILRYAAVRMALARARFAPVRYARFLRDVEGRGLLHRAGSGYVFPHRLIQEHLAVPFDQEVRARLIPTEEAPRHER